MEITGIVLWGRIKGFFGVKFTSTLTTLAVLALASQPTLHAAGELSGDKVPTSNGDLIIHPVEHATFLMS